MMSDDPAVVAGLRQLDDRRQATRFAVTADKRFPSLEITCVNHQLTVVGTGEVESLTEDSGGGVFIDTYLKTSATVFDSLLVEAEKCVSLRDSGWNDVVEYYGREGLSQKLNDILHDVTTL